MERVFINEAFTKAINDYLSSVENPKGVVYNSFLVIVIRLLIVLYSELDIVNPMVINDEELLKNNLAKYGYSKNDLEMFLSDLQVYYDIEKENENKMIKIQNPYFITIQKELIDAIIPFWEALRDDEYGGFYGYMDYDLNLDKKAEKGCILNSRITWFFASAYKALKDPKLLDEAAHGYEFLKEYCIDREYGGIYWSMNYDGSPKDTTKHTYNQAFSIYALSAYYEASGDSEALDLALQLFHTIEEKCTDEGGYLEAFTREFKPESNDKLSENGVLAERTMNTLLHALEAYTELYKVSKDSKVKARLEWLLDVFADKVYNPELKRQEVFFDKDYNSLIDLYSYGHDIETSWLLDRATEVLGEAEYTEKITKITDILAEQIYELAFDGHSVLTECEKGVPYTVRVWWVQAESIVGFINAYQKSGDKKYYEAAEKVWEYIKEYFIDKRPGSEWFWDLNADGTPRVGRPIVEPWKCPYHNGRMCLEIMSRLADGK